MSTSAERASGSARRPDRRPRRVTRSLRDARRSTRVTRRSSPPSSRTRDGDAHDAHADLLLTRHAARSERRLERLAQHALEQASSRRRAVGVVAPAPIADAQAADVQRLGHPTRIP